jgi:hypothetical protein
MEIKEFEITVPILEQDATNEWKAGVKGYRIANEYEVHTLAETMEMGEIFVEALPGAPMVQLSGFCTQKLAYSPLVYATVLHIPDALLKIKPHGYIKVKIHHDAAERRHSLPVFDKDPEYKDIRRSCSHILDVHGIPISRSSELKLTYLENPTIFTQENLREELDKRGWLSLEDKIEVSLHYSKKKALLLEPTPAWKMLELQLRGMQAAYNLSAEFDDALGKGMCVHDSAFLAAEKHDWKRSGRPH